MTTCSQCSTTYAGGRTEHCMGCHATFTSSWAGDKHRVGDHGISDPDNPNRRRCLTADEMTQKGMTLNQRGHWMLPANPNTPNPWSGTPTVPLTAAPAQI